MINLTDSPPLDAVCTSADMMGNKAEMVRHHSHFVRVVICCSQ
jgi:hypothetical protein